MMNAVKQNRQLKNPFLIFVIFYILVCILKIIFVPIDSLRGLGDINHFYNLAQIPGMPFIDYWVEFPPISAFLFEAIYWISNENLSLFSVWFISLMSFVNLINLILFWKINKLINKGSEKDFTPQFFIYVLVLAFFPYTWWYFDSLPLMFFLLAAYFFLNNKDVLSALWVTLGVLTKLFPILFFVVYIKKRIPLKKIMMMGFIVVVLIGSVYWLLYIQSPEMTMASMSSQFNKGSWETVWALIDGNYHTGNFGPLWERWDPALAYQGTGHAAKINSTITLAFFGLIGLLMVHFLKIKTGKQFIQLLLFTFCVFFLWSPGWSPQWVLYLIPLILLAGFNNKTALILVLVNILINLLEWPVILGLQLTNLLPITVISRSILFIGLGLMVWKSIKSQQLSAVEQNH